MRKPTNVLLLMGATILFLKCRTGTSPEQDSPSVLGSWHPYLAYEIVEDETTFVSFEDSYGGDCAPFPPIGIPQHCFHHKIEVTRDTIYTYHDIRHDSPITCSLSTSTRYHKDNDLCYLTKPLGTYVDRRTTPFGLLLISPDSLLCRTEFPTWLGVGERGTYYRRSAQPSKCTRKVKNNCLTGYPTADSVITFVFWDGTPHNFADAGVFVADAFLAKGTTRITALPQYRDRYQGVYALVNSSKISEARLPAYPYHMDYRPVFVSFSLIAKMRMCTEIECSSLQGLEVVIRVAGNAMITKLSIPLDIRTLTEDEGTIAEHRYQTECGFPIPLPEDMIYRQNRKLDLNAQEFSQWLHANDGLSDFESHIGQNGATEIRIPLSSLGFNP